MTDNHHRSIVEPGKPAHDRAIVAEIAIAVQLQKIAAQFIDIVEGGGALRMTG